jgi:hypothetical protein
MTQTGNFEGFPLPKRNYFPMPNNWTDITAEIKNLAELKVVEYVMRHTWGYREFGIKKAITTDEFMHGRKKADGSRMDKGTGLSNRSVIDGLRLAEKHGYLESDIDTSDKARQVKSYALKMDESAMKNLHTETDQSGVKILHSSYEDVTHHREESSYRREDSSHRSEKDTIEKHSKETPKKETGVANAAASQTSEPPISDSLFPLEEEKPQPEKKPRNTIKARLATLETFNFDQPATIENIMSLGDLWRGSALPALKRADSDYQKAISTATQLSQRVRPNGKHGYTLREIDTAYRFFKRIAPEGKPNAIADDWWKGKNVDVWVIAKNIDKALDSLTEKKSDTPTPLHTGVSTTQKLIQEQQERIRKLQEKEQNRKKVG